MTRQGKGAYAGKMVVLALAAGKPQPVKSPASGVARITGGSTDGELPGSVAERLQPDQFALGGAGVARDASPDQADYKDWMIHGPSGAAAENLAQSLSVVEVDTASVTHGQG